MLDIDEINQEIDKLENKDCTSYEVCQKLAILYTVRNNYKPSKSIPVMPITSPMDITIK